MKETLTIEGGPVVLAPTDTRDLPQALAGHREETETLLTRHGAVLFRGFDMGTPEDFVCFGHAASETRLAYTYRSTPRSTVTDGVFTTTEYPADQEIALHCENAYQRTWPRKLAFFCHTAATTGGETPLADLRKVTAALDSGLLRRFERHGVRYIRHYRPHIDLPWQTVFQTDSREGVAAYCADHGIDHTWLDDTTLRTAQTSQGVAHHPLTGERVVFNQAHLFHSSNLPPETARALTSLYGPEGLPRNATYGDGTPFAAGELATVREAFAGAQVAFPWQAGDVLLVDNMRMAHGRRPYTGPRRVLATLMEAHTPAGHRGGPAH
ncbi:TauD/TfdA family dioxygenase [Streptomyces sp. NBC_00525]|uniref:TauD/TfdA family dioxygenase n=1 Tax=Streptomyces sp. NBC_00525 TaxID=2903660 RepID=UPI002E81B1E4|nr:TauD/TfdA family dioxygenase [Streptomyces sp. NBC_00525]WUC96551.1 TauD/TfdA family dioxygenase [Streptomyces sp. NBC_00525]